MDEAVKVGRFSQVPPVFTSEGRVLVLAHRLLCQKIDTYLQNRRKFLLVKHDVLQVDVDLRIFLAAERVEHLSLGDDGGSEALHLFPEATGTRIAL